MMLLRYVLSHNEEDFLDALSSYQLQGFQDFQYVSYLKININRKVLLMMKLIVL